MTRKIFNYIWSNVLDLLLPAFCLGCRKEGTFLCDKCFMSIPRQQKQVCPECYMPGNMGFYCDGCKNGRSLDGVLACCSYTEKSPISFFIHAFKYDFVESLKDPLGDLVAECLRGNNIDSGALLCPVPLHKKRLKWRGFNQSELICERAANELGCGYLNLLKRVHFRKPQMELNREQRMVNTKNAFAICENSLKKIGTDTVILVDDVATTLSTLESCAEVLKLYGAKRVVAIVLARVY